MKKTDTYTSPRAEAVELMAESCILEGSNDSTLNNLIANDLIDDEGV